MRRAHRLDSNHAELVKEFERFGCSVLSLAGLGNGVPDICVGFGGLQIMCELKDGDKPPSARKLTDDEERFRMNWRGGYKIVEDLAGVEETVKVLQNWHRAIRKRVVCIGNDPLCPCQDGDACHYRDLPDGTKAFDIPAHSGGE